MKTKHSLAIGLLTFVLATPAVVAETAKDHAVVGQEAKTNHMLDGYADVSVALYKDDLAAAKKAAAGMAMHDKDSAMNEHAQALAESDTIEDARMHFKQLSDLAIPVAKKDKSMHQMHCPMAMDGKGADWLQVSADEVQNPYMGTKMPHCGKAVKW